MKKLICLVISVGLIASPFAIACKCGCHCKCNHHKTSHTMHKKTNTPTN